MRRRKVGNLLALAVLSVLAGGIPMHPYQLANVLRRTGKDPELKIKWGSLYTVVQNLERRGFIEATSSDREGRRPERTTYTITEAGREEMCDWVRELIADPERQHPPFETPPVRRRRARPRRDRVAAAQAASVDWHAALVNGGGLAALAAVTVWLSTRTFRGYQRTV